MDGSIATVANILPLLIAEGVLLIVALVVTLAGNFASRLPAAVAIAPCR